VLEQLELLRPIWEEAMAIEAYDLARRVNILGILFNNPWGAAITLVKAISLWGGGPLIPALDAAETLASCGLLRDIFGHRKLPPVTIEPALLTWNGGAIPQMAQAIYEERGLHDDSFDNHRLAVLADALEEGGCSSRRVLDHCRSPGPHVRGCWVVDLILERQ
jgi:hypothetical protein